MLKTAGRRSDTERNAFWAGVVALMPADLIENRQGRAMMRILDLPYRTIKRGNTMRKELEDEGKGWVLLKTKPHYDRAELHLEIIDTWWHSDEASCPDNQNKEEVRPLPLTASLRLRPLRRACCAARCEVLAC